MSPLVNDVRHIAVPSPTRRFEALVVSGAEIDRPVDVECTGCGCAFVNTAAFDAHRPDGTFRKPPDVGLVVANRGVVWLESARHLERP